MGLWLGEEKKLQCVKILNQETLNWVGIVCITIFRPISDVNCNH